MPEVSWPKTQTLKETKKKRKNTYLITIIILKFLNQVNLTFLFEVTEIKIYELHVFSDEPYLHTAGRTVPLLGDIYLG